MWFLVVKIKPAGHLTQKRVVKKTCLTASRVYEYCALISNVLLSSVSRVISVKTRSQGLSLNNVSSESSHYKVTQVQVRVTSGSAIKQAGGDRPPQRSQDNNPKTFKYNKKYIWGVGYIHETFFWTALI